VINFVHQAGGPYSGVLDAFIEPVLKYMPATKGEARRGALNVRFFVGRECDGVFMPHGIADKNYRNADKLQDFDCVFVSGPLWVEKLTKQGYPREKIFINGYTKLDPVFQGAYRRAPGEAKILYAPTHGAIKEISLHGRFDEELAMMAKHYEIISSTHPSYGGGVTLQALADADAVISDAGSLLYEALALGKPVIFADWLIKKGVQKHFPRSFEEQIYENGIGYHAKSPADLRQTIETALQNGIDDKMKRFIDGIFPPELRGKSGEATAKILKELSAK